MFRELGEVVDDVMPIIYIVVGVAGLLLLLIIAGLLCLYCKKRAQQKRSKKTFEQQMTSLESRVAKECREGNPVHVVYTLPHMPYLNCDSLSFYSICRVTNRYHRSNQ